MVFEKIMPQVDGAIWVWVSEMDYLAGSITSEIFNAPKVSGFLPNYNQATALGWRQSHWCTFVNAFRPTHGLWKPGEQIDEWLKQASRDYATDKWTYKDHIGNHSSIGFHTTKKFFDDELGGGYIYVRTTIGSAEYMEAINKWYAIGVTYRGNAAYNADYRADGVLDWVNFGAPTYWHMTCHKLDVKKKEASINDSYYGTNFNIYKLANLKALVDNGVYYPACYIMFPDPKGILEDKAKRYREEQLLATQWAINEWITNGERREDFVTRVEFRVTLRRKAGRPRG